MLAPKKTKFRKGQIGRLSPARRALPDTRGITVAFGNFGLKATTGAWVNSRQIEAARRTITNYLHREGKVWIRIFPDKPITARPPEVTMGGGKGAVDHYVFPVRPGRIMFEMDGVTEEQARAALRLAGFKLPVRSRFVKKEY